MRLSYFEKQWRAIHGTPKVCKKRCKKLSKKKIPVKVNFTVTDPKPKVFKKRRKKYSKKKIPVRAKFAVTNPIYSFITKEDLGTFIAERTFCLYDDAGRNMVSHLITEELY